MEWLKPILGDELYGQVADKLQGNEKITLVNASDGSYVPKGKFDEQHATVKTYKDQVAELNERIGQLTAGQGDADALRRQLQELQATMETNRAAHEKALFGYRLKDAIRSGYRVHDADVVVPLLRMEAIRDEGGKLAGLDEQMKELQKEKGFLFADTPPARGGMPNAGGPQPAGANGNDAVNAAIRAASGRH